MSQDVTLSNGASDAGRPTDKGIVAGSGDLDLAEIPLPRIGTATASATAAAVKPAIEREALPAFLPRFKARADSEARWSVPHVVRPEQLNPAAEAFGAQWSQKLFDHHREQQMQIPQRDISMREYLTKFYLAPEVHGRNVHAYAADALLSFGYRKEERFGEDILIFRAADWPWEPKDVTKRTRLIGQDVALFRFYQEYRSAGNKGHGSKMIIGHGPGGCGKTLLFKTRDGAVEQYSKFNPEGELRRVVFVFDEKMRGRMGFHTLIESNVATETLDAATALYRVSPTRNTNPIFLLPNERLKEDEPSFREQFVRNLEESGRIGPDFNRDYVLKGQADTVSQQIFAALLRHYDNDIQMVFENHVRAERWSYSAGLGRGLIIIPPSIDQGAELEHITPGIEARSMIPEQLLASARGIEMPRSLLLAADRGHVHYSDLARDQPLAVYNNILDAIEWGDVSVTNGGRRYGISEVRHEKADLAFSADINDNYLEGVRDSEGWPTFDRRSVKINIPNVMRFRDEAEIHREDLLQQIGPNRGMAPHTLETLALFAVTTRIFVPSPAHYQEFHAELPEVIKGMNAVEKALILQGRSALDTDTDVLACRPEGSQLNARQVRLLREYRGKVALEHRKGVSQTRFSNYDGGHGLGPAEIGALVQEFLRIRPDEPFTAFEICEGLRRRQNEGFEFYVKLDATRQKLKEHFVGVLKKENDARTGYNSKWSDEKINDEAEKRAKERLPVTPVADLVKQVEAYAKNKIRTDVLDALGLINEDRVVRTLMSYVHHASAWVTRQSSVPKPYRVSAQEDGKANIERLKEIESFLLREPVGPNESKPYIPDSERETYRASLIGQIGSWARANEGKRIEDYLEDVCNEQLKRVRGAFKKQDEPILKTFLGNRARYLENPDDVSKDLADAGRREGALVWQRAMEKLEAQGYPKESLAKLLYWVWDK